MSRASTLIVLGLTTFALVAGAPSVASAQAKADAQAQWQEAVARGTQYLVTKGQEQDGAYSSRTGIGRWRSCARRRWGSSRRSRRSTSSTSRRW